MMSLERQLSSSSAMVFLFFHGMSGGAALDVDDTQGTQEEFMGSNLNKSFFLLHLSAVREYEGKGGSGSLKDEHWTGHWMALCSLSAEN